MNDIHRIANHKTMDLRTLRHALTLIVLLALSTQAYGSHVITINDDRNTGAIQTDNISIEESDGRLHIAFTIDFSNLHVRSNRAVVITPYLKLGTDSIRLREIDILGRRQYYYYLRNDLLPRADQAIVIRSRDLPDTYDYRAVLPWHDDMHHCTLQVEVTTYGCCSDIRDEDQALLAAFDEEVYTPEFIYQAPTAEVTKMRAVSGSALICFPVNRTEIQADYMDNRAELAKIQENLDGVVRDADVRIASLTLCGYASPEGKYDSNARLAEGRTKAVKNYLIARYGLPESVITVSSVAENWQGLREYVAGSTLRNRDAILALIDEQTEPDRKEWLIKSRYADDYRFLLREVYPGLRHTDYRVDFEVKQYADVDEIRRLVHTAPQKLSLEEFYRAAQDLEPGSDEFNEIFEIAVRMFPDDEVANLNAANAAMSRGDMVYAQKYLDRAGNSSNAIYARGVYEALSGNMERAEELWKQAGH